MDGGIAIFFSTHQKRLRPCRMVVGLGGKIPSNPDETNFRNFEHLKNWVKQKVQMIQAFLLGFFFSIFSGANLLLVLGEWEVYFPEGWWWNHWWNQSLMKLDTEHQGSTLAEQNPQNPWSRWWQLNYFLFSPWTLGFHDPIWLLHIFSNWISEKPPTSIIFL